MPGPTIIYPSIQNSDGRVVSPGSPNTFSVGSVETLAPGENAAVDISGGPPEYVINFSIPRGEDGTDGLDGTIVSTGSTTPRTLADRFSDVVNVKDFGAVGDGVADDTVALQAAIDHCYGTAASPNGTANVGLNRALFIPHGLYKLTDSLVFTAVSGGYVYGEGRFTTTLRQTVANKPIIKTNGCQYSVFENMCLDNSTVANSAAIFDLDWDGVVPAAIQSNTFRNMFFGGGSSLNVNTGLRIGNSDFMGSENLIENCFFIYCVNGLEVRNYNALQNVVLGGNFQGCTKGIRVFAGSVSNVIGTGFQNDIGATAQILGSGVDISFENSASDTCVIEGCRTESMRFITASNAYNIHVLNCTMTPSRVANWAATTTKALNTFVNGGGAAHICTTAGVTGATEPTWGAATVTDGTVTWTRYEYNMLTTSNGVVENCILPFGQVSASVSALLYQRNCFTRPDYLSGIPYQSDSDGSVLMHNVVYSPIYNGGTIVPQAQTPAAFAESWQPTYIALDAGRAAIMFRAYLGGAVGFMRGKVSPNFSGDTPPQNSIAIEGTLSPRMVSGANQTGKDLYLGAGPGTGTGNSGAIRLRVAPAGSSGSSLNDWVDGATLEADKTFSAVNGLVLRAATAAAIASASDAVNATGKKIGLTVWDTTNNRMMVATGSTTTSAWYVCDGSASVTPT